MLRLTRGSYLGIQEGIARGRQAWQVPVNGHTSPRCFRRGCGVALQLGGRSQPPSTAKLQQSLTRADCAGVAMHLDACRLPTRPTGWAESGGRRRSMMNQQDRGSSTFRADPSHVTLGTRSWAQGPRRVELPLPVKRSSLTTRTSSPQQPETPSGQGDGSAKTNLLGTLGSSPYCGPELHASSCVFASSF